MKSSSMLTAIAVLCLAFGVSTVARTDESESRRRSRPVGEGRKGLRRDHGHSRQGDSQGLARKSRACSGVPVGAQGGLHRGWAGWAWRGQLPHGQRVERSGLLHPGWRQRWIPIGAESTDFVTLFMNKDGLNSLLSDQFTLGGDASVAAGPVGRQAGAATDLKLNAQILPYSRSKGLFAGLELKGVVIKADKDDMVDQAQSFDTSCAG